MNKNRKRIFVGFILFTFILLFDGIYARYSISKDYNKYLKSVPFYFNAFLESDEIEFEEDMAEFSIVVRNFDDESITSNSIDYVVSLSSKDQERFQLDGMTFGQLSGSERDERSLKLTLLSDELIEDGEEVTIVVTSVSPYKKVIEIPITLSVNMDYYLVHYQIEIDGNIIINDTPTELQEYLGISLDSIFGANRPKKITNNTYSFDVTIPGNYEADVYSTDVNGDQIHLKGKIDDRTYPDYPLGRNPVYVASGDKIVADTTDNKPSSLLLEYTYYDNDVGRDKYVVIKMTTKPTPVFDARLALARENLKSRGSIGTDDAGPSLFPNLNNPDNKWDWNFYFTRTDPLTKNGDTYSYVWTFQTNSGNLLLDSLEFNGTSIEIPFFPKVAYKSDGSIDSNAITSDDNITTTYLPDGAKVTLEFKRSFKDNTQRVYEVVIENALSDIVVTGGNMMQYSTGDPELVVNRLVGVSSLNGDEYKQSSIILNGKGFPELTFNVLPHYENPVVSIVDLNNNVITGYTLEVDSGAYKISNIPNINRNVNGGLELIDIVASPIRYAVKYSPGEITDAYLSSWYDDNGGNYYTIENSRVITLNNSRPTDPSGNKEFANWVIDDGLQSVLAKRGQVFTLDDISKYAIRNTDTGVYEVFVTTRWQIPTPEEESDGE